MIPRSIRSRITLSCVLVLLSTLHPQSVRAEPSPVPEISGQPEVQTKSPSASSASSMSCAPTLGLTQTSLRQAVSSSAAVLDCLDFETELKDFNHLLATIKTQLTHSHTPKIQAAAQQPDFIIDSSSLMSTIEMQPQYAKHAKPFKLTPKEFLAINFYSTHAQLGSQYTNQILVSKDKADIAAIQPLLALIDSGLNKLPDYKGEVLRGADIQLGQPPGDPLKGYKPGKMITSKVYTSSTNAGLGFFGLKNTHFKIVSKHGKDISKLTSLEHEQEVLFPRGTQFKVVRSSLPKGPGSPIKIEMEEVESNAR